MKTTKTHLVSEACTGYVLPIKDTLDILSGKWKLPIIGSLFYGKKRFKELEREIPGITPRMLSKELRELETNQLISRTVYATVPATVEYEVTVYGKTLRDVMDAMAKWGNTHRKRILGKKQAA
jgi:DNA-binding HxlR family transcriptional regulator